jgi:WD40 repeat protein
LFAVSGTGKIAVSRGETSPIEIYDVNTGAPVSKLSGYGENFRESFGISFIAEDRLAIAYTRKPLEIWDIETEAITQKISTNSMAIAASPDARYLATGHYEVWDAHTFRLKHQLLEGAKDKTPAFSPDSKIVAVVGPSGIGRDRNFQGGNILLWDVATGRLVKRIPTLMADDLAFSPDGRQLACIEIIYEPNALIRGFNLRAFNISNGREIWSAHFKSGSGNSPHSLAY